MISRRPALHLLSVCTLTVGCGTASPPPSAPSASTIAVRRVIVLGDSLSVSPSIGQAFPAQLQTMIERDALPWTVTNAGISGDTTAGGARRVQSLLGADVGVLVVELGANDGLAGIDPRDVQRNISSIVEAARARNISVLLCGMETLPTRGFDYVLAFHQIFPDVAQRYSIPLVPFLLRGVAFVPEMNGSDGIHPNAAGARRIAENVWPFLDRVLRARNATVAAVNY
jgi:acyl-CoA thioesterase I